MKLMQMRMNACTWCLVGKGIGILAQGRGIAEKQNREGFHFEKVKKQKGPIWSAELNSIFGKFWM